MALHRTSLLLREAYEQTLRVHQHRSHIPCLRSFQWHTFPRIWEVYSVLSRRKAHRSSVRRQRGHKRHRSISKEVEHLVLLGFMTIAFVICSLPLVIQVYLNTYFSQDSDKNYVIPLLLVSANPIIDPWVFIILSPPVPRLLWDKLCKTAKFKPNQEKVRSIHPVLNQSNPLVDSGGGNAMKVYTEVPGTAGS
ncbi:hypothetical protein QQF64_016677 [Cirrhinus molitorella]|uniref:G-protein coupled receptors family 1 profile domain-containing protein n=1 Tax=Cirrhinus molitorella TaxID=172907 RepID=A0ABR3LSL1_9TELE